MDSGWIKDLGVGKLGEFCCMISETGYMDSEASFDVSQWQLALAMFQGLEKQRKGPETKAIRCPLFPWNILKDVMDMSKNHWHICLNCLMLFAYTVKT